MNETVPKTRGQEIAGTYYPGAITPPELAREIDAAIAEERERCAKLAHFWTTDEGQSPCHGEALRSGFKVAAEAIERGIRNPIQSRA